jgi:hypothetical protein
MKWRGFDKEREDIENSLQEVGSMLSTRLHDRIETLFKKLSKFKGVKINYLIMGNGTYVVNMEAPMQVDGATENSRVDISEFNDSTDGPDDRYENVNPGICAVALELDNILMHLTDSRYLTLMGIDEKKMKKLVDGR